LPDVLQEADPWLSSEDISKGQGWLPQIREAILSAQGVGIFFLTEEALRSGWLLFEAGSIAAVDEHRVCTVCIEIEPHNLRPPLSFFQATVLEEGDVFKLLETLNAIAAKPLSQSVLKKSFDRTWPELKSELDRIGKSAPTASVKSADKPLQESDLGTILESLRRIEARLGGLEQRESYFRAGATELAAQPYVKNAFIDAMTPRNALSSMTSTDGTENKQPTNALSALATSKRT